MIETVAGQGRCILRRPGQPFSFAELSRQRAPGYLLAGHLVSIGFAGSAVISRAAQ
jgi:hypothetical protein